MIGFDIGGGTPSAARLVRIERMVQAAPTHFRLSNPVTISIKTRPHRSP